jgi:hypothetical protein
MKSLKGCSETPGGQQPHPCYYYKQGAQKRKVAGCEGVIDEALAALGALTEGSKKRVRDGSCCRWKQGLQSAMTGQGVPDGQQRGDDRQGVGTLP